MELEKVRMRLRGVRAEEEKRKEGSRRKK